MRWISDCLGVVASQRRRGLRPASGRPVRRWVGPIIFCLVAVAAAWGRPVAGQELSSTAVANVPHCFVTLAGQADLPSLEAGVIADIPIVEGQQVVENQLLLQLDDHKAQAELKVAQAKADAAKAKAKDNVNIRYSIAAAKVAKAKYNVNETANHNVPGFRPPGAAQRTVSEVPAKRSWPPRRPSSTAASPTRRPRPPRPKWNRPR